MNYSENMGLVPLSREQRLRELFNALFSSGLISMTFTEFKGSNIHRFFSESTLPQLEKVQEEQMKAVVALFTFWQEQNLAIRGSFGSSNEGWANNFAGLCRGLNIVDSSQDPTLGAPGNVAFYFDELKLDDEDALEDIYEAFRRSVWPGMITPQEGDEEVTVTFTSTGAKTYQIFNLKEEEYTPIDCTIVPTYKDRALQYEPALLIRAFREQFNTFNTIGKDFHPRAFFDTTEFPNLASVIVHHNQASPTQPLACGFREKFKLGLVTVGDA